MEYSPRCRILGSVDGTGAGELAEIVRKAARNEAVIHPHVAARVMQELRAASRSGDQLNSGLSEREMEALRLIAEDANNTEIAERLVISEHTVKRHVSNILSKLHLADRTQAAVYAWREGVVDKDS